MIKLWIERSMKRLRKVRGFAKVLKFKNKKMVQKRFITWIDQTNFLISLDERIADLESKKMAKSRKYGLQKLE